jgi:hypothetical protein
MLRSQQKLLSLAVQFGIKYAGLDASLISGEVKEAVQSAITNASFNQGSGIMPFVKMLEEDQAVMAIVVSRHGDKIEVSPPGIDPNTVAGKYVGLPEQIKNYLTRNLEVFPTQKNGVPVEYKGLTVRLEYPLPGSDIAKR